MTSSSWYRRGIWYLKGSREYTKSGYESASSKFNENDIDVDCSHRHFMITGANSGIGYATAVEIAKRGGVLHLVCRNATSMKEARSNIITSTGNDRIYLHQLNLSVPREVDKFASDFAQTHDKLDVLIHNAGCMIHERKLDENNIETSFAVNVLAVHILNDKLLPLIQKSEDPRVITVSSGGMLNVKLDPHDFSFEKMDPFDGTMAYAQNKRQQVVMNFCNAQRYDRVKFFSMHPGWADTPAVQTAMPKFHEDMNGKLRTPLQGADTVVWLAVSKAALKHASGLFFQDRQPVPTHLPLAWTRSSFADEATFMKSLDSLVAKICPLESPTLVSESVNNSRVERLSSKGHVEGTEENGHLPGMPEEQTIIEVMPTTTTLSSEEGHEGTEENGHLPGMPEEQTTIEVMLPRSTISSEEGTEENGHLPGKLEENMKVEDL